MENTFLFINIHTHIYTLHTWSCLIHFNLYPFITSTKWYFYFHCNFFRFEINCKTIKKMKKKTKQKHQRNTDRQRRNKFDMKTINDALFRPIWQKEMRIKFTIKVSKSTVNSKWMRFDGNMPKCTQYGMYGKLIEVMVIIALETYSWNIQMLFGV